MAISGGIKFFKKSKILDATVVSNTSGDATAENLLDSNKETFWRSVGSDDTTTEEIVITFAEAKTIDRLFLVDFNGLDFNVQYDSGGYTHFANVTDLDGSQTNITRTDYAKDTYYAEFDSVSTTMIRIQILKTQTVDDEKYINQVVVTEELSTLVGYPMVKSIKIDRQLRSKKTLSGKYSIQKSLESFGYRLSFKDYPSSSTYNVDIDAVLALHDNEDPFIVWLCGGRYLAKHFNYVLRGFRLKDVVQMQVNKTYDLSYTNNTYNNPLNISAVDLVEHI